MAGHSQREVARVAPETQLVQILGSTQFMQGCGQGRHAAVVAFSPAPSAYFPSGQTHLPADKSKPGRQELQV